MRVFFFKVPIDIWPDRVLSRHVHQVNHKVSKPIEKTLHSVCVMLSLVTMLCKLWIRISSDCFCLRSSFRSLFPETKASLFWASTTLMLSNFRKMDGMSFYLFVFLSEMQCKSISDCIVRQYLVLVPLLSLLLVLFGHFIVLFANLVEHLSQIGVMGFDLHLYLRVLDLIAQSVHLLQNTQCVLD